MSVFQLISILFATFMMYVVRVKAKKYHLPKLETYVWYSIWGAFIILAFFPQLLLGVAGALRFTRVFDLLTVIAFMILVALVLYLYFAVKELQIRLEQLVRSEALRGGSYDTIHK